jgi:Carboxypeptidase regulatory-like domain
MPPRLTLAGVVFASTLSFTLWAGPRQKVEPFELRTVCGTVLNSEAGPAAYAIVYLYDERTQSVKSYIADKTRHYRFSGLSYLDNYELHAERAGMASKRYTISNQDDRKEFDINLKIARRG